MLVAHRTGGLTQPKTIIVINYLYVKELILQGVHKPGNNNNNKTPLYI